MSKNRFDKRNLRKKIYYISVDGGINYEDFDRLLSIVFKIFRRNGNDWKMPLSVFNNDSLSSYLYGPEWKVIEANWFVRDSEEETIAIDEGFLANVFQKNYRFSIMKFLGDLFS